MIRESKHRKLEKQMTLKSLMEKKDVLDDLYSTWFTSVPLRSKPSSSSSLFQDDLPPEIHSSSPSSPRLRQEDPDPPHPATEPRHDWDALYRTYLNQVKNTLPLHVHEEHGQENEEIGGVTLLRRRCMPLQRVKSEKEQWVEEKWKLEVLENERKQRMVGEQDHDDDDDDDDDDDEEDIDVEDEEDDEEEEEEIDVEEQEEEEEEEVDVEEDDDNEERETNEVKRNPPLHLVPSNEPSSPLAPSMTCIKETSMDHLHPEKDHDHDHEVPDAFQPPTTFAEWIQWVQGRSLTSMQVWLTQLTMWSLSEKHSRRTQYLKTLMWVFMAFHDSKPTGPVPKKKEEPLLPNDDHPDEDDPLGSSTSSAPPTWVLPVSEVQAWWSVLVPYFVQLVSDDESHVERFLPWLHQTYFSTPSSTCLFTHPSSQVWTGPHLLTLDFVFTVYSSTDFHHPILTPLTYQVTHSLAHLDVVHFPHALHHGLHFVALLIDFHVPHKWVPEVVNFLTQCLCLPISIQEHEHEHEHEHERKHKQAPTLQDLEWGSSPRDSLTQHASHSSSREAFNWLYSTSSSTSWYGGGVQPLPTALRSSLLSLKSQDDPPPLLPLSHMHPKRVGSKCLLPTLSIP
ncbi:hypothetical protein HMI55_000264 [Coelomomyces lativittatus]|nr:hypothetical protein HMI55_000264 [Coelomomyces lativittatus]